VQWVTRVRPKVGHIACPWLIKRLVELGHHGVVCSFDAIIKKYDLSDPAFLPLARIVRGADTPDTDLMPESRGLEAIANGFRQIYTDDHEPLSVESIVYDVLYEYCQHQFTEAR
jgi:hypothetical protein